MQNGAVWRKLLWFAGAFGIVYGVTYMVNVDWPMGIVVVMISLGLVVMGFAVVRRPA